MRRAIADTPGWSGGQGPARPLLLRDGRLDEAEGDRPSSLMAEAKSRCRRSVRWLIGQELEDHSRLQDLAEELYEAAVRDFLAGTPLDPNEDMQPPESGRLLPATRPPGRVDECRDLILKLARMKQAEPDLRPRLPRGPADRHDVGTMPSS